MFQPLTLLAVLALTQAPGPRVFSVNPAQSTLGYQLTHKLHQVNGESTTAQGKVAFLPDGRVQVMVRAPVASFRSGDGNRDAHMQEVVEAAKHGSVTFKAVTRAALPDSDAPQALELSLTGELDFHGRKHAETVTLKVAFPAPGQLRVSGAFEVSLERYEIERPGLLFVKVDDGCRITLDLSLEEDRP